MCKHAEATFHALERNTASLATAVSWTVNEVLCAATAKAFIAPKEKTELDNLVKIAGEHEIPPLNRLKH